MKRFLAATLAGFSAISGAAMGSSQHTPSPRSVYLKGEIDRTIAEQVVASIKTLDGQDATTPIYLHIDSRGGDLLSGYEVIEGMKAAKAPVYTVCDNFCAGIAVAVLVSGAAGHRVAFSNATLAMLPLTSGSNETVYDETIKKASASLIQFFATATYQPKDVIAEQFSNVYFFDATTAQKTGYVDKVSLDL